MKRTVSFALVFVVLTGGLLAGCGDDDGSSAPPPNTVITIQPQPEATIVPGCQTSDLEGWYEVVSTLIYSFRDESAAAVELPPEEISDVVPRLQLLRDTIAANPTPECAIPIQGEIVIRMRGMLVAFQRYGNGDITQDEMRLQIDEAIHQIDTEIAALLSETQVELEEQLRQQRDSDNAAAPTATSPTTE